MGHLFPEKCEQILRVAQVVPFGVDREFSLKTTDRGQVKTFQEGIDFGFHSVISCNFS
jgi:hypothetical protein